MPNPSPIHFIIALPAEAKPLRQALGLHRDPHCKALPVYRSGEMRLALSGPGRRAAERAVALLADQPNAESARWLNLGIAGHPKLPLGALVRAATAHDAEAQIRLSAGPFAQLPAEPLYSLDKPCFDYRLPGLTDMEGFGFASAVRACFPTAEPLILKLVSDNPGSAPGSITGKAVEAWIRAELPRILAPLQPFDREIEPCG